MKVRRERDGDASAIGDVLIAAFGRETEARLVERLRAECDLALTLVAEERDIFGYVGFPRLTVDDGQRVYAVVGLAPVAVAPAHQQRGVGSALIHEGHRLLTAQGESLIFVLAAPAYYVRFGYDVATTAPFKSAYSGPHFMALRLNENAPQGGKVSYPAAFADLG